MSGLERRQRDVGQRLAKNRPSSADQLARLTPPASRGVPPMGLGALTPSPPPPSLSGRTHKLASALSFHGVPSHNAPPHWLAGSGPREWRGATPSPALLPAPAHVPGLPAHTSHVGAAAERVGTAASTGAPRDALLPAGPPRLGSKVEGPRALQVQQSVWDELELHKLRMAARLEGERAALARQQAAEREALQRAAREQREREEKDMERQLAAARSASEAMVESFRADAQQQIAATQSRLDAEKEEWKRCVATDVEATLAQAKQTLAVRLEAERDRELQVVAARLVEEMVVAERDAKAAYERRMEEMRDAFTRDLDQMYEANTELRARATSLAQENGALRRKHREGLDRCERKWERKLATLQERHARLLRAVSAAGIRERRAGDSTECMPTDVDTQSGANGSLLANGVQMVGGQITSKKRHKKGHAADKVVLEGLTNGAGTCPTLPSIQRRPRGEPGGGGEAPCESSQASGPTTPHGRDADEDAHASAEAMSSEGGHRPSSGAGRHHRPPSGSSHHAARGGSEAQPSHARDGQGSWEGPAGDSVDGSGAQVDGGDAGSQEQERRRDADGDGHGGGAGHRGSSTDGSEGGSTGLDSDDSADSNYSAAKPSPFSRGQASLPHCRMEQGGVLCSEADSGGGTDGEEGGEGDEGEEGEEGVVGDEGEEGSGTEGEEQGGGDDAEQQLEALMLHRLSRKDDAIRALENRVAQLEARLGQEVAALLAAEEQMALLRHELGQLTDAANERDRALVAELAILESILKRLLTSRDCLIYTLGQDVLGMEKALAHANRVLKDTLHEIGTGMVV
eukprot:jgi/Mesvir1/3564/Mv12030-RA.1